MKEDLEEVVPVKMFKVTDFGIAREEAP